MKNFEPLVRRVRGRINLKKNVRLREALSERGDPAHRLDKELPGAVAIEWNELYPDREPPASEEVEKLSNDEIKPLVNKVCRRLEKQADEREDRLSRSLRRLPTPVDDEEAQAAREAKVAKLFRGTHLTKREREYAELFLDEYVEEDDIPEWMGLDVRSVDKLKYKVVKKLRESAEKQGIRPS